LVVNPESPDGTHEYLAAVANSYPHLRIREIIVEPALAKNKGAMINHAVRASRGQWVWLADADCLFPPTCLAHTLTQLAAERPYLYYGQRRYLGASDTSALLSGRLDGLTNFELLCQQAVTRAADSAPWGYTQILERSVMERIRYRENINHFAHSDTVFVQDCQRHKIFPRQVEGLFCLHLDHPFSWYGTNQFL
jgi:cellulose synthase/poly-beta-1,6-N-acetylglucosamine synthase-like glycosyltransferase